MSWQDKMQFWKKHDDSVENPISLDKDPLLEHRDENPFMQNESTQPSQYKMYQTHHFLKWDDIYP